MDGKSALEQLNKNIDDLKNFRNEIANRKQTNLIVEKQELVELLDNVLSLLKRLNALVKNE